MSCLRRSCFLTREQARTQRKSEGVVAGEMDTRTGMIPMPTVVARPERGVAVDAGDGGGVRSRALDTCWWRRVWSGKLAWGRRPKMSASVFVFLAGFYATGCPVFRYSLPVVFCCLYVVQPSQLVSLSDVKLIGKIAVFRGGVV